MTVTTEQLNHARIVLNKQDARERETFERVLAANTARLMDFAKPYVGRLSNADREALLKDALAYAWRERVTHKPKEASLLEYWDRCLKAAALQRETWRVSRFDGWTTVRGDKLGAQET